MMVPSLKTAEKVLRQELTRQNFEQSLRVLAHVSQWGGDEVGIILIKNKVHLLCRRQRGCHTANELDAKEVGHVSRSRILQHIKQ